MSTEKFVEIKDIVVRIREVVEMQKKIPGLMKSGPAQMELVAGYLENAARAKEEGRLVVVHGTQMPIEIFYAMDISPLFNELYSVIVSMMIPGGIEPFFVIADEQGTLSKNCCSFARIQEAMEIAKVFPHPDLVVFSSSVCDNMPKALENLAQRFNVPYYGMDRPYTLFASQSMDYWRKEHEKLITFLEEQTGRKMDYDRLKEVVSLSYRCTELCLEIDELCKVVPCPMSPEAFFGPLLAVRQLNGRPEAVAYLEGLRDELQERVDKGIGAVNPERFRVLITPSCPYFDMGILPMMQQNYGAVCVADFLQRWRGKAEWLKDPSDPVGNLACKVEVHHANSIYGPVKYWLSEIEAMAREYRVDAALWFDNYGCRHASGAERLIKDTLGSELGVPMLNIGCDILDKTFTTRAVVEEKMDRFFEMVENSKNYRARRKTT
jgi:benzoyl-CoA reductase/2-hydroxyglutaryl-CoA dehydratase subunit BcrC/BadD/HgdB